jgi:PEP-CTERM motif
MFKLKTIAATVGTMCLLAFAAPSHALPSLTFKDGADTISVDPFNGFDWQSNATAVVSSPVFDGTTIITTSFLASAVKVKLTGGGDATLAGLNTDYEFTVRANIQETASCIIPLSATVCGQANFKAVGGTWDIYYDQTKNSDITTGTGFVDGTKILTGVIAPNVGPFSFAGTFTLELDALFNVIGGSGNFDFKGAVAFTETDTSKDAYFAPTLASSNAASTLQIGSKTTSWTAPTTWVDGGGIPAGSIVFQADGNQTFEASPTRVPEPGSLALVGLSLMGLALARRSIAKK